MSTYCICGPLSLSWSPTAGPRLLLSSRLPYGLGINMSSKKHVDSVTGQGAVSEPLESQSGQRTQLQRESTACITPEAGPLHLHLGGSIKLHLYQGSLTLWFKREEEEREKGGEKRGLPLSHLFLIKEPYGGLSNCVRRQSGWQMCAAPAEPQIQGRWAVPGRKQHSESERRD